MRHGCSPCAKTCTALRHASTLAQIKRQSQNIRVEVKLSHLASMAQIARQGSSSVGFFESLNPLGLLHDATKLTPHEFLRDFYTRRGLYDKLKDVDALVAAYGKNMSQLYVELDKKCVLPSLF
ncbi:hypothetical protein PINS_up012071 [Pythium insidiosum]|nr:hypothetical protein PINS_up012071 [Pythium insidiosum]